LTHTILVLETVELDHGVYRKMYTLIGGQRAEKFENHCPGWSNGPLGVDIDHFENH